jgi:hypothetical protein
MKTAIAIVKNIVFPQLEKDTKFDVLKTNADFWETFTKDLLCFEEDAKPLYASIYSLELDDAEKVISKLPGVYSKFLKELAESYVLGQSSEASEYLLKTQNDRFLREVQFMQIMQQAIKSVERKRIKADLPNNYSRLAFELSENDIANVAKKKGREDLKEKFRQWDTELEQEVVPVITMKTIERVRGNVEPTKAPPFNWVRFAVAASIIIATGIFFFRNTNQVIVPANNTVVTTDAKKDSTQPQKNTPEHKVIVLAAIETVSKKTTIQESESMGFSGAEKHNITINYKDASKRIASLEKFIDTSKTIDSKIISQYKAELASLKIQKDKYVFDGKELTLFMKNDMTEYSVLLMENQIYFLKKGSVFYHLKISKVALLLDKVSDATTIETLEQIHFENQ